MNDIQGHMVALSAYNIQEDFLLWMRIHGCDYTCVLGTIWFRGAIDGVLAYCHICNNMYKLL